jgi:hypothetical protein
MSNFRPTNRDMDFLMPPSVDEWLPQRHRRTAHLLLSIHSPVQQPLHRALGDRCRDRSWVR